MDKYEEEGWFFSTKTGVRLAFRVYLLNENEPERFLEKSSKAFNGENMDYKRLMDHKEEIKKRPSKFLLFMQVYNFLIKVTKECPTLKPIDEEKFYMAFCKVAVNSIGVRRSGPPTNFFGSIDECISSEVGWGLYMGFARFDHSCNPNCLQTSWSSKMEVRCIRGFDSEKEEALISYINPRFV